MGLSSWSCVAVAYGNAATPTLDTISHELELLLERHHRERDGEYQKARRHFGHACHETLNLQKGLIHRTTGHMVGLIFYQMQTPSECRRPHGGADRSANTSHAGLSSTPNNIYELHNWVWKAETEWSLSPSPSTRMLWLKAMQRRSTLENLRHRPTGHMVGLVSYQTQTPSASSSESTPNGPRCSSAHCNSNVSPLSEVRYSGLSPGLGPYLRILPLRAAVSGCT